MLDKKKIAIIMPGRNVAKTVVKTINQMPKIVDEIIVVDDGSTDGTSQEAKKTKAIVLVHEHNRGYGGALKTGFSRALEDKADIIIVCHPDNQYPPQMIPAIASMINSGYYDEIMASRLLGKYALRGGMPIYKFIFNNFLNMFTNLMINNKLSEYHSGYRGYSARVLRTVPFMKNSEKFTFDIQLLLQSFYFNFRIGEMSCPTLYKEENSSLNFIVSSKYGFGVIMTAIKYRLCKFGIISDIFRR